MVEGEPPHPQHLGRIRLFSPKEVLNLMGFPRMFAFPPGGTLRHRWKQVGNSISVTVVTALVDYLLAAAPRT
jgi:tRNA (cytosine38-C5)-methyltransferase